MILGYKDLNFVKEMMKVRVPDIELIIKCLFIVLNDNINTCYFE
jgi:hypothetical protein